MLCLFSCCKYTSYLFYKRLAITTAIIIVQFQEKMEIKVVDVDRIGLCNVSPSDKDYQITGDELFRAFEKVGFVYIKGHGVSKQTIEQSMEKSRAFFNLPIQKKKQMLRNPEIQQGYVEAGMELFNSKEVFIR